MLLLGRWIVVGGGVEVATTYTRSQGGDTFQYRPGDRTLVRQRDRPGCPAALQQRHLVGVVLEADVRRADVVGDDESAVLAPQLRLGVGHDIARLRGETDQQLPGTLVGTESGEDVGCRL